MALIAAAMDQFGNGMDVTDEFGGCISYARSVVGGDVDFQGPKLTIEGRFKWNGSSNFVSGLQYSANGGGAGFAWRLEVDMSGGSGALRFKTESTACGAVTLASAAFTKNTTEHHVAATYDTGGNCVLYYDGVAVATVAAACANLAIPSAGSNALEIWGSFTPGIPCVKWQNVRFAKDVATAAEILDRAQNGTPGDLVYTKSGLQWWFAADKIHGLSNGAAIPTWNDNGLSARNLTQSTGGRRWTYQTNAQNGLAVARATGTDKFMAFPGGYSLARGVYTFHVALNYTPGQSGDMPLIVTSSGNGGFQLGLVDTDPGSTLTHFFSGNSFNFGVAAVSGFQVLSWVVGGGTVKTYRNGTLIDTQSYVVDPGQTDAQWLLGTYTAGDTGSFRGDLGEMILYNAAHNATDRDAIINYLKSKWGVS